MNIPQILSTLRSERDRLDKAIAALEGIDGTAAHGKSSRATSTSSSSSSTKAPGKKKRGLTPAGRRRLSENMKKRWAERRKKAAKPAKA